MCEVKGENTIFYECFGDVELTSFRARAAIEGVGSSFHTELMVLVLEK